MVFRWVLFSKVKLFRANSNAKEIQSFRPQCGRWVISYYEWLRTISCGEKYIFIPRPFSITECSLTKKNHHLYWRTQTPRNFLKICTGVMKLLAKEKCFITADFQDRIRLKETAMVAMLKLVPPLFQVKRYSFLEFKESPYYSMSMRFTFVFLSFSDFASHACFTPHSSKACLLPSYLHFQRVHFLINRSSIMHYTSSNHFKACRTSPSLFFSVTLNLHLTSSITNVFTLENP